MSNSTLLNPTIALMPQQGALLTYADDKVAFSLTYQELKKFWDYASADDIEYACAYTQGEFLLCNLWTASGQGGIVLVADRSNGSIIHISEGAFAVTSIIYDGVVISLCDVAYWGMPAHLELSYSPLGIKDAWADAESIPCDEISSLGLKDMGNLSMNIEQGILKFGYDGKWAIVDIDHFLKTVEGGVRP